MLFHSSIIYIMHKAYYGLCMMYMEEIKGTEVMYTHFSKRRRRRPFAITNTIKSHIIYI